MTGSQRHTSSPSDLLIAPYVAPQGGDHAAPSSAARHPHGVANAAGRLAPFIPPAFRGAAAAGVAIVPAPEYGASQSTEAPFEQPASPAAFGNDATDLGNQFASAELPFIEGTVAGLPEFDASTGGDAGPDLPWIDAYAEDPADGEDTWPMGEAGRRLDELTESLSSMDANRARQQTPASTDAQAETPVPEAPLPMWNEEEWMDIMPTTAMPLLDPVRERFATPAYAADRDQQSAESAARALEGLALRIRNRELPLPAFSAEIADEAMLAGVLASLLGWRQ